jgi:hypothetical protein
MWDMDTSANKEYNSVDDIIYLMEKIKKDVHQLDLLLTHHRTILSAKKTEDKKEG